MDKDNVYIYFSGATDRTGTNLMTGLGITGGKKKPTFESLQLVIGWGAKTKEDVSFPKKVKVLNHPNAIRTNRNKFESLRTMAAALNVGKKRHIPQIVTADTVKAELTAGNISLPLIGRTKYHQGGKGFWECPTMAQLDAALAEGEVHHFQSMIPVVDEYRLHIFEGECIHAVKKVQRSKDDFEKAWIADELARQKDLWAKNNTGEFNEEQALTMLKRQAKDAVAGGPNMVLRSNKMGWKFSIVKKFPKELVDVAAKAVKALGLNFGAVDCCLDTAGNQWVFEVNTGPGLEGTSLEKYIAAFEEVIGGKKVKVDNTSLSSAENTTKAKPGSSKKEFLSMQLTRLQEMLAEADDKDVETIEKLGKKLIFGGQ